MLVPILLMIFGIALLYYGGEWLVKGSSRLALQLGVRPIIIGLTVVSFGTSAPELVSSLVAQVMQESGSVAIGNVIGSNIYNIGLVLGAAALITVMTVQSSLIRREIPVCIAVSCLLLLLMWDGEVSRVDGLILLLCFVAYLSFQLLEARRTKAIPKDVREDLEELTERFKVKKGSQLWLDIGLIVLGSLLLVVGADFLVRNAITVGRTLGISERVIGLTAVAFGTSLPELATSIVAALRKEVDIAVGNVVGSNIFNVLLIVGSVASIKPLSFEPALLYRDGPVMLGLTVGMVALLIRSRQLRRLEGVILLASAMAYTVFLFFS